MKDDFSGPDSSVIWRFHNKEYVLYFYITSASSVSIAAAQ